MIDNRYKGEVTIRLDDKPVTLRFTLGVFATLTSIWGDEWQEKAARALIVLDAADLAVMLEICTEDEEINITSILESEWSLSEIARGLRLAIKHAHHGLKEPPQMEDRQSPNVMKPQKTTLWICIKRLVGRVFHQEKSGI